MSADRQPPPAEFLPFGKIPRLRRSCLITEKIDGTNAQVCIERVEDWDNPPTSNVVATAHGPDGTLYALRAGSRNRYISPEADNAGFARWVEGNAADLTKLGEGRHYGEWWGQGIQRRYNQDRKRFSLFNAARWGDDTGNERPACCDVVPVLYDGIFTTDAVEAAVQRLRDEGSLAAPGFTRPEGVIVYQVAARTYGKVLLENDELPKSVVEAEGRAS